MTRTGEEILLEPLSFQSDDLGLVEATVSQLYSKLSITAVGESTRTQITRRVMAPSLGFDDLDYSFDIGYAGEAKNLLIVCDVVSNTIRRVGEGCDEIFGPGDLFLITRPNLPYEGLAHSARLRFMVIDPGILARVAASPEDHMAGPVDVLDHRPVSPQAALQLRRSIAYVRDSVMDAPEVARSPLLVSTASQYLAANVLHAFPNTAETEATTENGRDSNLNTLHRAVAFIESNPDLAISVVDIARAAYVTPRALQLAFRHYLDITPMGYLRRVRLSHAHDELARATPGDGASVTAVAYRWGFSSSSHFARHYRATYGTTPSDTLRN